MTSFTQAAIDTEINNQLLSGSEITALALRSVLHDMNAAAFQSIPPTVVATGSVLNALSPSSYSWTATPSLGVNGGTGGSLKLYGATSGSVTFAPSTAGSTFNVSSDSFGTMLSVAGPGATIANQVSTLASITGTAPKVMAIGTDINVSLVLQPQGGSGAVTVLNGPGTTVTSIINGIQIGAPTGGDKGAGTLNSASTIYVNNSPVEAAQRVTGTVGATGSTDFSLILLPGSTVIGVTVFTTTAFGASGTAVNLTAGSAVGDAGYIGAQNIKALGVYQLLLNGSLAQIQNSLPNVSPNYFIRLTQLGTPSNTGAVIIVVRYVAPP
jgi:hypothetical protein